MCVVIAKNGVNTVRCLAGVQNKMALPFARFNLDTTTNHKHKNMQNITQLHHSSVIVASTAASVDFYSKIIGLTQLPRPELPYPGAWFAVGTQQVHLLELPNSDPTTNRPQHGGRDRHIAFSVLNLSKLKDSLKLNNIQYTLSASGRKALFCRDLDGNALEFIEQ